MVILDPHINDNYIIINDSGEVGDDGTDAKNQVCNTVTDTECRTMMVNECSWTKVIQINSIQPIPPGLVSARIKHILRCQCFPA